MLQGLARVTQQVRQDQGLFFRPFCPPPPHLITLTEVPGPFLSIPWSGHTLAAGLSGVLKGSEKPSEIVKMLRKEKSWPSEQFGQSLINWKRTSAREAPAPSQHCVDSLYLTASWTGALILELIAQVQGPTPPLTHHVMCGKLLASLHLGSFT